MVWLTFITVVVLLWYIVIILRFRTGINKNVNTGKPGEEFPSITVLVALKNEISNIDNLVSHLKLIEYPEDKLEIKLIDDNSTDSTLESLNTHVSSRIQVLSNTGNGKKKAIEFGVESAKGDWVAVTDADCVMSKDWLKAMIAFIADDTKMVLSPVFISNAYDFLSEAQTIEFLALQGATSGSAGIGQPISANGANMMFDKKAFLTVNPYESNYHLKTGDDQFLMMAINNEYPNSIIYAQDKGAIIRTSPVKGLNKYIAQRVRWASKGSAYSDVGIKMKGAVIFLTSILVITNFLYGIVIANYLMAFGFILIKLIVDLVLIMPMKEFSGSKFSILNYLISGMLYPLVVVITVVLGLLKKG